jgi:ferritin-like metal-binding protein YciE
MPELQELLTEELRDLYDAEKQLAKALPKLAKSVANQELKQSFLDHAEVTRNQVTRIERCFEALGERAKSKPCKAMKGLVEEAQEHLQEHEKGPMLDAVLMSAARKVEHYEIASYMSAREIAKALGQKEAANLIQETLREEEQQDKAVATLAGRLQKEMARSKPGMEEGMAARGRKQAGSGSQRAASAASNGRSRAASGKSSRSASRASARGNGSTRGGRNAAAQVTTDHDFIREWAEERGAKPACVRGTGGKSDTGMIRLDFPGYSGGESLQEISWDEFFDKFDSQKLALLYQEQTSGGQKSNFNKLIGRETAQARGKGGKVQGRRRR